MVQDSYAREGRVWLTKRPMDSHNGVAIAIDDLSHVFVKRIHGKNRQFRALEGVNLSVRRSEFLSIVGPSGCGKSTLLRIVAGLLAPTAGESRLTPRQDGRPPRIGMAFQSPVLLPWRTALDNVLLPIELMGSPVANYRQRARDLLALVGLADFERHYPWQLSGGMQQRNALAQALVHDPDIVLMDEPFGALDALTREQMAVELQRIWSTTATSVIFITHSIEEAVFLSDRVVVFSAAPGRVLREISITLARPRSIDFMLDRTAALKTAEIRDLLGHNRGGSRE